MIEGVKFMEIPEVNDLFDKRITNITPIRRNGVREVYKATYNGCPVILKKVENSEWAKIEFNNLKKASDLLKPHGLKVPRAIEVRESWILLEFIPGKKNALSFKELQKALEYLHVLHSSDYSTIPHLYSHYYGENLINRLNEEKEYLHKAIKQYPRFSSFKNDFEKVLEIAINHKLNDSPVIGHGDFQAKNIIVNESEIVPLDWRDFGELLRWYDVGNLLFKSELKWDELLRLVKHYLQVGSKQSNISSKEIEKNVKEALSITFIIRTGSHFRHLLDTNEDSPEDYKKVETNIQYIKKILRPSIS